MIGIKICGLCRPEDAAEAADAGATHGGVILADGFRRTQTVAAARAIFNAAGNIRRAGVFVNQDIETVVAAVRALELNVVQLHGTETLEFIEQLRSQAPGVDIWKAVRVSATEDVSRTLAEYGAGVNALLLDGFDPAAEGGAGKSFSWSAVAPLRSDWKGPALVLAGGLTSENVAAAIVQLHPDIVDVSSGVEAAVGEKSAARIAAFIAAARAAHPLQKVS